MCMRAGLDYLFKQVSQCERIVRARANPGGDFKVLLMGGGLGLDLIKQDLVTISFHWYAVTACNYAQTVWALACQADPTRPRNKEYLKRVLPGVKAFRDKFAAHLAGTTNHPADTDADRDLSVMPPLFLQDDTLRVNGWVMSKFGSSDSQSDPALTPWSLTEVHRQLAQRYWPDAPMDARERSVAEAT